MYQLHPLPVPQDIAVEESQRTYVLMNHRDVAACTELLAYKICKGNLPVNENGKFRTCEAELLLNPSLSTFQICNVQVTYEDQFDWSLIESLGGWLYSLQEPTIAITTCPNQVKHQITLRGTGIIQLAPGCDLSTKERTLPGTTNRKGETKMIYAPLLHLNISALSPALQEFQGYIPTRKSMSGQTKETTPGDKVFETNDKPLEHLEQQLYDFSLARRDGNSQIRMIHGSYLGLGLISIGLTSYIHPLPQDFKNNDQLQSTILTRDES